MRILPLSMNSLFFNAIPGTLLNSNIITKIQKYADSNREEQIYIINSPLGDKKYVYEYQENIIIILSPNHKIIILDLYDDNEKFDNFVEDFTEDLGFISDKFNYKNNIGRVRKWKNELIYTAVCGDSFCIQSLLDNNKIEDENLQRKNELLISLLIGSINNVEKIGVNTHDSLLEKIKNKILLFDGEQTRFIYNEVNKKRISIQGMAGTGKTVLLLHKLKEIYLSSDSNRIFFTCHNKVLSSSLRERIPEFFNFMKVEKQIKWNERLWVTNAWGKGIDINSGLYRYICNFYDIPFLSWSPKNSYEFIFNDAFEKIEKLSKLAGFKNAFDYILIDESQDFPEIFFKLCEIITQEKVYVAGDIFQRIFDLNIEEKIIDTDFVLNRCYRTDPRTLMFAHAVGMGLFESKKLNWLTDEGWKSCGYNIKREESSRIVFLDREPIRRFKDLDTDGVSSMNILTPEGQEYSTLKIIEILEKLKIANSTISPDDIAIILLDNEKYIYKLADDLEYKIFNNFDWKSNKIWESKGQLNNTLTITNANNAKGLEFPFVICITKEIKDDLRSRNILYTMLTRSFIQSYLLTDNTDKTRLQIEGLNKINEYKYIETVEPTENDKLEIKKTIISSSSNKSQREFLEDILKKHNNRIFKIDDMELFLNNGIKELDKKIPKSIHFDESKIIEFLKKNLEYYL